MINQNLTYPIALLLSSSVKKNFESLGREVSLSGDSITRMLMSNAITTDDLLAFCTLIFGKKAVYLIVDDTLIKKIYSRLIEEACDNYDSSQHHHYRSLCSVVAMVTDGEMAIPVDQKLWFSEEYSPDNHQKKWEIAKELLIKLRPLIRLKIFIADGLYAVAEFMEWLITAKQYLGMNDCMVRKQQAQEYHIMNVFLAYAFAQYERFRLGLQNVESAIKSLKQSNFNTLRTKLSAKLQIFCHA